MQITKEQVKAWHACTDGFRWFLDKFPQGGAYADVHGALPQRVDHPVYCVLAHNL